MTNIPVSEIIQLIGYLDDLFILGGKLIEAAVQKKPELQLEPLEDLSDMDKARREAIDRIKVMNDVK